MTGRVLGEAEMGTILVAPARSLHDELLDHPAIGVPLRDEGVATGHQRDGEVGRLPLAHLLGAS